MGNFKQDYERDFGPLNYEPLDPQPFIDRTKRRALDIQGSVPSASPRRRTALDIPDFGTPVEEQGAVSGLLKTGTAMLGEAGLGAVEYGMDKLSLTEGADVVQGVREELAGWRESVYAKMSDEVLDMKGREFLTLDPDKTIWKGGPAAVGKSLMYKLVEQVPMTLATLVPGGLMLRAGSKGALTYLGASEAGLSVGFIQNEIKDGIAEMTDEELMAESPRFRALYDQLGSAEARNQFEAEATGMAPVIGGLLVGAIGWSAGRYLQPILEKGGGAGIATRAGRGFVGEGVFQEAPQEAIEQLSSNVARAAYDGDVKLLDGVAEAAVQGVAVGGPMGAGFGVIAGRGPEQETPLPPSDEDLTPVERDRPDPDERRDVLLPETDLFGDPVTSVDDRDPLAETQKALTLTEEYEAIDVRNARERTADEMTLARVEAIRAKPVKKRTKQEKEYLAAYAEREARRTDLAASYGQDPSVSAAISAAVGRMGQQSRMQQNWVQQAEQEQMDAMVAQGQLGVEVGQAAQAIPTQPPMGQTPSVTMPGGQQTLPGMDMTDATLQPGQEPTRAYSPERFDEGAVAPDQPTEEPLRDIQAQLSAMDRGEKQAVLIPADTVKRHPKLAQDELSVMVPQGLMVFRDKATFDKYELTLQKMELKVSEGDEQVAESLQKLIGKLTGSGEGKPLSPDAVTLQKLDAEGNVERESLVATPEEAEQLQAEWQAETRTTARVIPLMEKLGDMTRDQVEEQYGAYAEDFNWVEKVAPDGQVIERSLRLGEEATQERVQEYEQEGEGSYQILTPEETLGRREERVQEEFDFARDPAYEEEFQRRQRDLFDVQPEIKSQTRNLKVSRVGPRVRVMDGDVVLWEKVFRAGFEKDAEAAVKQLEEEIGGIEGLSIWQDKAKDRPEWQGPRGPRVATQREVVAADRRVQDRELEETVGPKMKEAGIIGPAIQEVTEGAQSTDEVVENLLEKGRKEELENERQRVAGIVNPKLLSFSDKQAEAQYRKVWDLALDAELRKELKSKLQGDQKKEVMDDAAADLKKAQSMITELRKGGIRWKRKPNKYFTAAKKVDRKKVEERRRAQQQATKAKLTKEESDVAEIMEATQTQQAQYEVDIREEAYGDTEYDVIVAESQQEKKDTRAEQAAEQATAREEELSRQYRPQEEKEYKKATAEAREILKSQAYFDSKYTTDYVQRLWDENRLDLNTLQDLAVQAVEYRVAMSPKQSEADGAKKIADIRNREGRYAYPSELIRQIGAAANVARNQETKEGRSRKRFLVLPVQKRGKVRTQRVSAEGLTAQSYREESKGQKAKRLRQAQTARGNLQKNAPRLEKKIESLTVDAIETQVVRRGRKERLALPTSDGVKQLLALDYLKQLAQLARMLDTIRTNDPNMVKLLTAVDEAVKMALTAKKADLSTVWFDVAQSQAAVAGEFGTLWAMMQRTGEGTAGVRMLNGENIRQTFPNKKAAEEHRIAVKEKDATLVGKVKKVENGYRTDFYRQKRITERKNAAQYYEMLDTWRKSEDFNTFVWPLVQRITAAYYSAEGIYNPTVDEANTLKWLLDLWNSNPQTARDFGTPLRALLRNVGRMKFDKRTKSLVVEDRGDGRMEIDLPENFDKRERFGTPVTKITGKMAAPTRLKVGDFNWELKRPTRDLFGNRIPWNKQLPYQQAPEEEVEADTRTEAQKVRAAEREAFGEGTLFTQENIETNTPSGIKAVRVWQKFRKIVDNPKSTIGALIDAEEKMLASMKELGVVEFVNFAGLAKITLPDGTSVTYRQAGRDLDARRITKEKARQRMRSITKRLTQPTAEQRRFIDQYVTSDETYGLPMFDDSYVYSYDLENYRRPLVTPATTEAVSQMGDLLLNNRQPPQINQLLDILGKEAKGPFAIAARKLQRVALAGVKVKWAAKGSENLGSYDPKTRTIYLNENTLIDLRNDLDFTLSAKVAHTVLHEAAHAATLHALRTNASLRKSMDTLRQLMQTKWNAERFVATFPEATAEDWKTVVYGFKNAEEFVAEMFGNSQFQRLASMTDVSEMATLLPVAPDFQNKVKMNAFQRFKKLVRDVLGFEGEVEGNVFDMVMAMSDMLFEGAGRQVGGGAVNLNVRDASITKVFNQGWDRLNSAWGIEERVRSGLNDRGERGKFIDRITSMSQLGRRFGDRLEGLSNYVKAFRMRNARNAELMTLPQGISREWTTLQEAEPEMAAEMSDVMTLSSLYRLDPTVPMGHERNQYVNSEKQRQRYRELAARYKNLSPDAVNIWKRAREYYSKALKQEASLLLLNALRGVVKMDKAAFDKKYNVDNILKFNTQQAIEEEFGDSLKKIDLGTVTRMASLPELKSGVYFPLSRYGNIAVEAQSILKERTFTDKAAANEFASKYKKEDPTYQTDVYYDEDLGRWKARIVDREFHLFESVSKAKQEMVRLNAEYDKVVMSRKYEKYTESAIASNKQLSSVLVALDGNPAAQAAIKNFYLRNLADSSFRKREINRKQVKGANTAEQHRNFAVYAKQASYYTAQLEFGWQMSDAITEMENFLKGRQGDDNLRLGMVLESVKERDSLSQDLVQINPGIRGLLGATQFWMLTSASYHMINSSQPWMVTLPTMAARHGLSTTYQAMKTAQSKIIGTLSKEAWASKFGAKALTSRSAAEQAFGVYDQLVSDIKRNAGPRAQEYLDVLEHLRRNHILEISPMTELREIAGGQGESFASRALDASRIMAHLVEINNRVLTAMAAYDLEMAKSGDQQAARDYAELMIETTQFNYSTANKPPLFQQLPWMFQFMQWSQHIYALMIGNMHMAVKGGAIEKAEARRALFGLLGTHAMVGGVLGVALQPIKMALGMVALMFSDEDDPITAADAITGQWFDREVTQGLADVVGSDLAMILSRGLPMALGTDLSTRMSLGTLYFVDIRDNDPEHVVGSLAMSFGGAPMSQVIQWSGGAWKIAQGDWYKGIEQMSPKMFRDMLRAGRYYQQGLVNRAGDTVIPTEDISPWQLALQFVGFAPEQVSRFYAGQGDMKFVENFVRQRKAELLREYRTASDANERMRIRKEIREFNRRYRYDPIKGSAFGSTVKGKAQRERGYDRYGASIDPKKARQYQEYGDPYR